MFIVPFSMLNDRFLYVLPLDIIMLNQLFLTSFENSSTKFKKENLCSPTCSSTKEITNNLRKDVRF